MAHVAIGSPFVLQGVAGQDMVVVSGKAAITGAVTSLTLMV